MKLTSHSTGETGKIAANLAHKITKNEPQKHAVVLALEGELGAGKTTFVKAFAKALKIKAHITSPTFVLMKRYVLTTNNFTRLFHIDAYRLKNYHDLASLGVPELMADTKNIILIEWADRIKPILPKKHIKIHIDHVDSKTRRLTIL